MPPLLASFFTLAGNVHPFRSPVISPIAFRKRAEAAAQAGFRGIGFHIDDLSHILETLNYRDIARILDDNGLVDVEIELLRDWFGSDERLQAGQAQRRVILDAAGEIDARHVKIGTAGELSTLDHMADCFAMLCDDAAKAGTSIVMEISPIGRVNDLASGKEIVQRAGRPNGRLLLDIWHVTRMKIAIEDVAALPPGMIGFIELNDGAAVPQGDYIEETVNRRLQCGEGAFAIADFWRAVAMTGYEGPVGIEILSEENRSHDVFEVAQLAFDKAISSISRANGSD